MIAMLAFSFETFALVAGCLLERRCPIIVGVAMKTLLVFACLVAPAAAADYDPLLVDDAKIEKVELTVKDAKRSRELPILIYLPKDKNRRRWCCAAMASAVRGRSVPTSASIGPSADTSVSSCSIPAATIPSGRTRRSLSAWRR